jgi:hypothetical protein
LDTSSGTGHGSAVPFDRVRGGLRLAVEGNLNPMIFVPSWFRREALLRDEEVEVAQRNLEADSFLVAFKTDDFSFVASTDRLELVSLNEGLHLVLRDLALNMFTLLRHTPLSELVVTRFVHLARDGAAPDWSRLVGPHLLADGPLPDAALSELALEGTGPRGARTVVSLRPSDISGSAVVVECTYAFPLEGGNEHNASTEGLMDLLKNAWDDTKAHSDAASAHLAGLLLDFTR